MYAAVDHNFKRCQNPKILTEHSYSFLSHVKPENVQTPSSKYEGSRFSSLPVPGWRKQDHDITQERDHSSISTPNDAQLAYLQKPCGWHLFCCYVTAFTRRSEAVSLALHGNGSIMADTMFSTISRSQRYFRELQERQGQPNNDKKNLRREFFASLRRPASTASSPSTASIGRTSRRSNDSKIHVDFSWEALLKFQEVAFRLEAKAAQPAPGGPTKRPNYDNSRRRAASKPALPKDVLLGPHNLGRKELTNSF